MKVVTQNIDNVNSILLKADNDVETVVFADIAKKLNNGESVCITNQGEFLIIGSAKSHRYPLQQPSDDLEESSRIQQNRGGSRG